MSIHVYTGPMFGGKSDRLMTEVGKMSDLCHDDQRCIIINHVFDNRDPKHIISTHATSRRIISDKIDVKSTARLSDIDVTGYSIIGIDEAQFFEDLYDNVSQWVAQDKHIFCAGLDGTATQKPFGQVALLLPIADEFIKIPASCELCKFETIKLRRSITPLDKVPAPFTRKIAGDPSLEIEVGNGDKYVPVCRKHII